MKKKIALFLATIMTVAVAMPASVFAAEPKLTRTAIADGNTLFVDPALNVSPGPGSGGDAIGADYVHNGMNLTAELNSDDMANGGSFELELTNAEWAFFYDASKGSSYDATDWESDIAGAEAAFAPTRDATGTVAAGGEYYNAAEKDLAEARIKTLAAAQFAGTSPQLDFTVNANIRVTWDEIDASGTALFTNPVIKSNYPATFGPNLSLTNSAPDREYDYIDEGGGVRKALRLTYDDNNVGNGDIVYNIEISIGQENKAKIVFEGGQAYSGTPSIRLPLVTISDDDEDCYVEVVYTDSSVTPRRLKYSSYNAGATTAKIASVKEGYDPIALDVLTISERRAGVIKNGWFYIECPDDYYFVAKDAPVKVYITNNPNADSDVKRFWSDVTDSEDSDFHSRIYFHIENYVQPATGTAAITITGLTLKTMEYDYDKFGDISLKVSGSDKDTYEGGLKTSGSAKISEQTITAAKRVNYDVTITAGGVKEVYSGYRDKEVGYITMKELIAKAWNMEQQSTFTLTDEDGNALDSVKISGVEFPDDLDNIDLSDLEEEVVYYNKKLDSTPHMAGNGRYTFNNAEIIMLNNKVTLRNFKQKSGKKATLMMKFYISAEAGFEGDVYVLPVLGGLYNTGTVEYSPVKIATVVNPVKIETKSTSVQIGYSLFPVSDVIIQEHSKGALAKDTNVTLTIKSTVGTSRDINFAAISKTENVEVDDASGMKVNLTKSSGEYLELSISTASKNGPATIKLSGLSLYVNRNAPYGDYALNVGGDAILDNDVPDTYTGSNIYDYFETTGISFPKYISVATEGTNPTASKNVKVQQNSAIAIVDGKEVELGAPSIIVGNSMFVPIRFLVVALGIDEKNVLWNAEDNTCTILAPNRTVSFQKDSSIITINSGKQTMIDANGDLVKAVINPENDRMYIPFRYLGDSLGLEVAWDAETNTAIYNPVKE